MPWDERKLASQTCSWLAAAHELRPSPVMRYEARRTRQSLLAFASMAVPVLAAVLRPAKERIVRWNPYDGYTVNGAMRLTKWLKNTRSPVWMVLFGLVARVLYIVLAHSYRFSTAHWSIFEMANLGYSLAAGHGFSSPFGGDTGPSAWTAPLYPWVISLAFRAFGICSYGAAFAMLRSEEHTSELQSLRH